MQVHNAVIAVLPGPRIHVDVLCARFANAFNAFIHVAVRYLRLGVGNFDSPVVSQLELGCNLEFRLETDAARIEVLQFPNIWTTDNLQVLTVVLFLQVFGNQLVQSFLTDLARVILADDSFRRLSRTKPLQVRLPPDLGRRRRGCRGERLRGNHDVERVLTPFYQCQSNTSTTCAPECHTRERTSQWARRVTNSTSGMVACGGVFNAAG